MKQASTSQSTNRYITLINIPLPTPPTSLKHTQTHTHTHTSTKNNVERQQWQKVGWAKRELLSQT